jgi:hypothetical protein
MTTAEEYKSFKELIENASLSELAVIVETADQGDLLTISEDLERHAQFLLRKAEYIEQRAYFHQTHDQAVKAQNKVLAKVRKALGFSITKYDINF